jgi:hypothetical protein
MTSPFSSSLATSLYGLVILNALLCTPQVSLGETPSRYEAAFEDGTHLSSR